MGLRRYANRRDANESHIITALEALGCMVYRLDKPVDLLVLHRGKVLLVEVKTKRGTLTKDQITFAQYWPIHIIRTVDDAIALVRQTRKAA